MDAAPMTIADQLQRIHRHAEAMASEAALKVVMHRSGTRHPYSADELLQMRGEKVVEYLRGKDAASCREVVDDLGMSYTNTKELLAWLLSEKRILVCRTTTKGRRFYEVRKP